MRGLWRNRRTMNILDANIGSAKDNMSSPVHNWYKFTAGFSFRVLLELSEQYKHVNQYQ